MSRPNAGSYDQLADGTWRVKYLVSGERRRESGFPTKTAARRWHADNVLPVAHGRRPAKSIDRERVTLADLVEQYAEWQRSIGRAPSTVRTVHERMRRPLDAFGETPLTTLEAMARDIAVWRGTLPPRYAPKVMGMFRQVLAAGVRWRLLDANPAVDAGPNPEAPPAPVRVYSADELARIADELPPMYAPLPAFGAATGLRPEEWSALERRHVDTKRRLVRVEQTNIDGRIKLGTKRVGEVARDVPLSAAALAAYEAILPRIDTPLLFPAPGGGPLHLDNFRNREWTPAVEAAGVARPATPYDMRDTFASNALAATVTVFELARVMGTSVRMIERHYGTLIDGAHASIVDRLDAAAGGVS